jgi:hypothetical protein
MRAVCPSCNGNNISLSLDVEVKAIFEDGVVDLNAPSSLGRGVGYLSCIDCGTVEDERFHRGEWVMVAEINYDKEIAA